MIERVYGEMEKGEPSLRIFVLATQDEHPRIIVAENRDKEVLNPKAMRHVRVGEARPGVVILKRNSDYVAEIHAPWKTYCKKLEFPAKRYLECKPQHREALGTLLTESFQDALNTEMKQQLFLEGMDRKADALTLLVKGSAKIAIPWDEETEIVYAEAKMEALIVIWWKPGHE